MSDKVGLLLLGRDEITLSLNSSYIRAKNLYLPLSLADICVQFGAISNVTGISK